MSEMLKPTPGNLEKCGTCTERVESPYTGEVYCASSRNDICPGFRPTLAASLKDLTTRTQYMLNSLGSVMPPF